MTTGLSLPPGTVLREYVFERVIGEGGFGIVYLAVDVKLERQVAIKEYLPAVMAARAPDSMSVVLRSQRHAETFELGLRSFVNEAKLLARFDHPALVKVHQFWQDHGTAYMVMPYYVGPTLQKVLSGLGRPCTAAEVRAWLVPLLDALATLHRENCFHRDIAPDNILITDDGPLLLDFGAARRVIGDLTHALTAVLKPGYAPIEQYGEASGLEQGPWTDIFALASVLYQAISGKQPQPSVERLIEDRLPPLAQVAAAGGFAPEVLAAVDRALALRPKDRPQSVDAFRAELGLWSLRDPTLTSVPSPLRSADVDLPLEPTGPAPTLSPTAAQDAAPASVARPDPSRRRRITMGLVAAASAALAAAAWWTTMGSSPPVTPTSPAPPAVVPPPPAPDVTTPPPVPISIATPAAPEPPPPAPATAPSAEGLPKAPEPAAPAASLPAATPVAPTPTPAPSLSPAPRPTAPAAPPKGRSPEVQARCGDILQKGSLQTLSAEESAFLKKECR